jgi:hypothetical protein
LRWFTLFIIAFLSQDRLLLVGQESAIHLASATTVSSKQLSVSRWPFELRDGQFQIHSTVPIETLRPNLPKLNALPGDLKRSLAIAIVEQPIHIVVLENRESLDAYVKRLLPNAPSRRAFYIRHRGPGLVLTYCNASWLTDVRHECTHALLDASGVRVPQWLDEGLAEYFETVSENPLEHATHCLAVQTQMRYGQVADLMQLERSDSNAVMSAQDYRDAWSITAFALNFSPQTRFAFQQYLLDLQNERAGGFLSHRLQPTIHSWREDFTRFFGK